MAAAHEEQVIGGRQRWSAAALPPIGVDLTPEQQLACAFRILARDGFSENLAGHITWVRDDGTMWANPWGKWWDELRASDICVVGTDGELLQGEWDITPAIFIHTGLHRARADAKVVIHNHPYYATLLAAHGILPDVLHQTGCLYDDDLAFVDEYAGEVDDDELGDALAEQVGECSVVVLANHGVIVTGESIDVATYRAANFDRMCRLMYDTLLLGREHTTVATKYRKALKASLLERAAEVYWAGAVRMLLRDQPDVLE